MSKAYVLGEKSLILGFKGVGFEVIPAENAETLARELARLARTDDVGVVMVTESVASLAPDTLRTFRDSSAAILTTIPTHLGSEHTGFNEMRKSIEYSIGVDMLGKE